MISIIKKIAISTVFISLLNGCGGAYEAAMCPPDCPEGLSSSSVEETDKFILGEWALFLRQIDDDQATEISGEIVIDRKVSNGFYNGKLKGKFRSLLFKEFFSESNWSCDEPSDVNIFCSEKELIEHANWDVNVLLSEDGVKLVMLAPNGDIDIFMDVHDDHIGRRLGKAWHSGEETYLMAKIINGRSALDTMDIRTLASE